MRSANFALFNVDQLVTMAPGIHPLATGPLGIIRQGALAAEDAKIVWVGPMEELHDQVRLDPNATVLNTHGRTVLPGFVDPHTHPIFAGDRTADFYARARGADYLAQVEAGGLLSTVRATRAESDDDLLTLAYQRAETFLRYGTTTIGARTGYGLTPAEELRSLAILNRVQRIQCLKVVPSLLAAHAVPAGQDGDADGYIAEVTHHLLPAARGQVQIVDAWCDPGAFTAEQCRTLLRRARDLGFQVSLHANELAPGDGARLAAELRALSVDHLVYLDEEDVTALAAAGTVAVLLPGTSFFLGGKRYAPARLLIDRGVPVALGTDFNPGTSFTQNMQFILTLAVLYLGMSAEEAVQAATLGGARAMAMEDRVGSLQPGKFCDFAVFSVADYRAIPYFCAMNLVESVVANGQVVVREGQLLTDARPAVATP